jgi:polyribonucleotide nucleotidyltransferase
MREKQVVKKFEDLINLTIEIILQAETTAREELEQVLEKGLNFAGEKLMQARKVKEAFVAETRKKSKRSEEPEVTIERFKSFISPEGFAEETYIKKIPKTKVVQAKLRPSAVGKKRRQHAQGISRSH